MINLTELQKTFDTINNEFIRKKTEKELYEGKLDRLNEKLNNLDIDNLEKINIIFQKMSEHQRSLSCQKLEELCTYALRYALCQNYEFKIELSEYRKKPSADIFIIKNNSGIKTNPIEDNGGGIIDIISMALRFVIMQVTEPTIDGPVILDEPYKMVSEEFVPLIANFLKNLSKDFNRQIIICTHNKFLAQIAEKQIFVTQENDESFIEEVPRIC